MKDAQKILLLLENGRLGAPNAQRKDFIKKVMFLAAVGRPHKRPNRTHFCGLNGIWPFVREGIAARSSKNRAAGETELKLVIVDGNVWRDMMVEKVFPAIRDAYKALEKASCYPNRWGQAVHKIVDSSIDRGGMLKTRLQHNL